MLRDRLAGHDNAFGFLRLLLATLVIIDHAYPLGQFGLDPMWGWSRQQDSLGGIAVSGFFAISGYLVAKSSMSADVMQFLWRRMLRIFPAYWMVLLVAACAIGPALWWGARGTMTGYLGTAAAGPVTHITGNFFLNINQYGIHDLLAATTPYGQHVHASVFNGSLWTLIYEWRCYLLVGALAAFGVFRRAPIVAVAVTAALYVLLMLQTLNPVNPSKIVAWLDDPYSIRYTAIFMFGTLAAIYAGKIPCDDRLGVLSLIAYLIGLCGGGYFAIGYPAMVYLLLWLAWRLPAVLRRVGSKNDYSYGVYLYGFLVQQVFAHFGFHQYGFAAFTMLGMVVSFLMAAVSWHVLEKWALMLKNWGPGKGLAEWGRIAGSVLGSRRN